MDTSFFSIDKDINIPYEQIVKQNKAGIIYLENDVITFANEAFLELIDKPSDHIIGCSIFDFIASEDKRKLEDAIAAMKNGLTDSFSDNLQLLTDKEDPIYFSLHLSIHTKTDTSIKLIGASRNATVRVKKMEELITSKSMLDALYNNIVDGIMIYDYSQERIIDCNASALKIFGYQEKEELLKINRFQFVPQFSSVFPGIDFHEETKNHGQQVMNGEAFKTPGAFVKANGEQMIVHANVVPTFQNYGEAYIIFQDSTKRILEKQSQKAVEKKYKDIFQNSHEGIIYTDANTGQRIVCNDKALQLFGVSNFEELKNLSPNDFFAEEIIDGLSPNEMFSSKIKEVLQKGKVEVSFWLKKQTGETIRVVVVITRDLSDKKHPKIITFIRDITDLYKAELALNEKNNQLQTYIAANLQLENFAYIASHDLQTPLRSIVSFSQLLRRSLGDKLSSLEEEYLDFIVSSTKNMRSLVMDILSYSQVDVANINVNPLNPQELIREICHEMREDIEEKKAIIKFEHLPNSINADYIKLKQLFQNLISNAVKFSTAARGPIVNITCQSEKDHWLFSIQDNGIGIEKEFYDKIFLIFKRLHSKKEYDGTGIGLAMVKKIVEQHEGEIWLESTPGEGTSFWFTIKKEIIFVEN